MQKIILFSILYLLFGCTDYSKARMYYVSMYYDSSFFEPEEIKSGILSKEGLIQLEKLVYTTCLAEQFTKYTIYESTLVCSYRGEIEKIRLNCRVMARCIE